MQQTTATAVSLEQMLKAREQRVLRQQQARAAYGLPLLSLSLVTPGPVKDSPHARRSFHEAVCRIDALCSTQGWRVVSRECFFQETGPEALYVIMAPAHALKEATVALEDQHPLGRLWDMDILPAEGGALSRADLQQPPRKCLVCGNAAHACARSRAHPLDELQRVIEKMIEEHGHANA